MHYDVIEGDVCLYDPPFRDKKYREAYQMNYFIPIFGLKNKIIDYF